MKYLTKILRFSFMLTFVSRAHSQAYETDLTGTVIDPSGRAVAKAKVNIVNLGTNALRSTETSEAGSYYVGNLSIGRYRR
jgi:hypothetical protein